MSSYVRLASVDLRQCKTVYCQRSVKQSNDGLRYSSGLCGLGQIRRTRLDFTGLATYAAVG